MEVHVDYFYGVYPSSVYGNLLLLDPLLPPVKCPLRCIICPLQLDLSESSHEVERLSIPIDKVLASLKKYIEPPIDQINGVLIWGYGDPLYITNLFEFLVSTSITLRDLNIDTKIFIHTSLIPLVKSHVRSKRMLEPQIDEVYLRSVMESIDGLITPFTWYTLDLGTDLATGWSREIGLSEYVSSIRELFKGYLDKIYVELYLFKLHEALYPDPGSLDEAIVLLKHAKISRVVLKGVDRPVHIQAVKPPPESYVEKVGEILESEGFKVYIEKFTPTGSFRFRTLYNVIYNQVLRIPLSYSEIKALYGLNGIIAVNNLIERKYVNRKLWVGETYYIGRLAT